ncbi:MAG TPA: hypothetical protein VFP61_02495, partial [Acidimicrobiales bacterium]|nr:hypothetical protein [Acidimicrobiales bacterium]
MHWIADYRVHGSVDDPDAGVVRYRCSAPARLRLDDRSVLVEVVDADVADLLADLSRWAAAAASFAAAGTLAVPLEVGPGERPGTAWVSRIADPTGASATL